MITLSLNNQQQQVDDGTTLSSLLEKCPPAGAFAVAINGEFIPRSRYADTVLSDGDSLDIVNPVGGG